MARRANEAEGSAKADAWRRRLERFERSGLTVAAFCAAEGTSQASFYLWRKRLSQADGRPAAANGRTPKFVPLEVAASPLSAPTSSTSIRIELPRGIVLELPADRVELARAVVRELLAGEQEQEAC